MLQSTRAIGVAALLLCAGQSLAIPLDVRVVHPGAAPGGNGQSWAQAYSSLQEALDEAASSPGTVTEIWLVQGDHRPTREREPGMPESKSFEIAGDIAIYGGFEGTEELREDRDPSANATLLTGTGLSPAPYHVVRFGGDGPGPMLDGIGISGGLASGGTFRDQRGGGVLVLGGSPTLVNCTISGNQALSGGGMAVEAGTPSLLNCTIQQNAVSSAGAGGGGVLVLGGELRLRGCTVEANSTVGPTSGGGLAVWGGDVRMDRTRFVQNTSDTGGALYCAMGSVAATNSLFGGNTSGLAGQNLSLTNCTIINNLPVKIGSWAGVTGSGLLTNCVVWGNRESWDAGIVPQVWGDIEVRFSCVEPNTIGPALVGLANTRADPLLDPAGRLSAYSPCIDAGLNAAVTLEASLDLDGKPRLAEDVGVPNTGDGAGALVDLGAWEFQGTTCYANCDRSTAEPALTVADFSCFLSRFMAGDPLANCDGSTSLPRLNVGDFTCFLRRFSAGCP